MDAHGQAHAGVGHVMRRRVLFRVLAALLVLTYVTVAVTSFDFGRWNLVVAMAIAVVKASLVLMFFMHLKYDKIFHTVVFVSAILAASLFVGFTLMDTSQYQHTNIWNPDNPPAAPVGPRPTSG